MPGVLSFSPDELSLYSQHEWKAREAIGKFAKNFRAGRAKANHAAAAHLAPKASGAELETETGALGSHGGRQNGSEPSIRSESSIRSTHSDAQAAPSDSAPHSDAGRACPPVSFGESASDATAHSGDPGWAAWADAPFVPSSGTTTVFI